MANLGRFRIWLLLALLSFLLMYVGQKLGDRHGLLAGFLLALIINFALFFYSELLLSRRLQAQLLEGQDAWGVTDRVRAIASAAGISAPQVYRVESRTPAVLSLGITRAQSSILLTSGLFQEFTRDEIEAALAFEIARIARGDTSASTAAAGLSSGLARLAEAFDRILGLQLLPRVIRPRWNLQLFRFLLSPLVALLARFAINPRRYLASDAYAASLIEDPRRMARVIWKLNCFQKTLPLTASFADSPLYMVNPLTSSNWYRYLQTQPPVELRVQRLVGRFPM